MSADVWLVIDTGGAQPVELPNTAENITYNLSRMLKEAGFPGHPAMVGAPASEAGGVYAGVADRLLSDPDRYKRLNPKNGWGNYEGAVEFCQRMAKHCTAHPRAHVGGGL